MLSACVAWKKKEKKETEESSQLETLPAQQGDLDDSVRFAQQTTLERARLLSPIKFVFFSPLALELVFFQRDRLRKRETPTWARPSPPLPGPITGAKVNSEPKVRESEMSASVCSAAEHARVSSGRFVRIFLPLRRDRVFSEDKQ